jgi:uncharacterized membrane protein (UPF0127 family)
VRQGWLLRQGEVLCSCEQTETFRERSRGLLGYRSYEGAMLLLHTRSVHSLFLRFPVDVAFLDADNTVVGTVRLGRFRMALPRRGGRRVLEAEAGAFERWGLTTGDRLEFRPTDP